MGGMVGRVFLHSRTIGSHACLKSGMHAPPVGPGHVFGYLGAGTQILSDTTLLGKSIDDKFNENERKISATCFGRTFGPETE